MTLGTDILQAVKAGGLENWTKDNYRANHPDPEKAKSRKQLADETREERLAELLSVITTKPASALDLCQLLPMSYSTMNQRLGMLLARKSIGRCGKQPYLYYWIA